MRMDEGCTHDARYRLGWHMAQQDWDDGAVNIQALQDWTSFGVGYRDARRQLRDEAKQRLDVQFGTVVGTVSRG